MQGKLFPNIIIRKARIHSLRLPTSPSERHEKATSQSRSYSTSSLLRLPTETNRRASTYLKATSRFPFTLVYISRRPYLPSISRRSASSGRNFTSELDCAYEVVTGYCLCAPYISLRRQAMYIICGSFRSVRYFGDPRMWMWMSGSERLTRGPGTGEMLRVVGACGRCV